MQIRFDTPTLFGNLRSNEALVVLTVVEGLNYRTPIEVKLGCGAVYIPTVCLHIRHELCSCLATAFDE